MTILAFVLLLSMGALCSMSETSYFSLKPAQLLAEERFQPKTRNLLKILKNPRQLLVSLLLLNISVNILVQNLASDLFSSHPGWLLQVGLPLFLTFLFSDLLPKLIAMTSNLRVAYSLMNFVKVAIWIQTPIQYLVTKIASWVSSLLFFFIQSPQPLSSRELLMALNAESKKNDSKDPLSESKSWLSSDENSLLQGLVSLEESKVEALMRTRDEIIYYDLNDPIEDLFSIFEKEECSKLPVCQDGLDHMKGMLYAQDLLVLNKQKASKKEIVSLLKNIFFVPSSAKAIALLPRFQRHHRDIAIVVNEYGVICGLLTAEDLLESVVGDIFDQRDQHLLLSILSDGAVVASAKVELNDLENALKHPLPPTQMNTLGGLLNELYGDIPTSGTIISHGPFEFRVLIAEPCRVLKVHIHVNKDKIVSSAQKVNVK